MDVNNRTQLELALDHQIKSYRLAIVALYCAPVALLTWFIAHFGVNVPYWDQWELVALFTKIQNGTVSFLDFWAQHNEHRIVLPKIIFAGLAFASNWNNKLEMFFSLLLSIATFCLIYSISLQGDPSKRTQGESISLISVNILSCFIFFSLMQYENWLWGFQVAWFLVNLLFVGAIACLTLLTARLNGYAIILAGLCCFLASFSSAQGLVTWLAISPLVFVSSKPGQRIRLTTLWIAAFIAVLLIYRLGYTNLGPYPSIFFFFQHPLIALNFLLTLLGSMFEGTAIPGRVVGFLLLVNFLSFNIQFLKRPDSQLSRLIAPWLSMGWFSIIFAIITTFGRVGLGIGQATLPRYTTAVILLPIAIIQIWRILLQRKGKSPIGLMFSAFSLGVIFTMQLTANQTVIDSFHAAFPYRAEGKLCLELAGFVQQSEPKGALFSCLSYLGPEDSYVFDKVNPLDKLGFFSFAEVDKIKHEYIPNALVGFIDFPSVAEVYAIEENQGTFMMTGWSALVSHPRIPPMVFLSVNNSPLFSATEMDRIPRPSVASLLGSPDFLNSGWQLTIDPKFFPEDEGTLKVWVYDPIKHLFLKLTDQLTFNKSVSVLP
jgi:hypothetical protein